MGPTARRYDAPARRAQTEETRNAILAAFAEQLGRPGAVDISVPEAAARAGVSVRTVYHHFPDRAARMDALADWVDQVLGPVGSVLDGVDDIPEHIRLAYRRAERHESLTRAGVAAGFSSELRQRRLAERQEQFAELVATVGAPEAESRRATAVLMVLATSDAGLPLVDLHGLTFAEAGEAAAEAATAVISHLRSAATGPPVIGERRARR